jgi:hypothetical protein
MQGFKQFRKFQQGEFIVAGVDTAAGGKDNCAAQFLSHKWLDVPMVYHSKVTASFMTPLIHEQLTAISKETGIPPVVAFERNNGGGFEMDRLSRLNRYGDYKIYTMKSIDPTGRVVDTGKLGWDTNTASRPKMLQELRDAVDGELIHVYHRQTLDEMFSFIVSPTGKPEAEKGAHDDLVMSLAVAWQLYQTEEPHKDDGSSNVVETSDGVSIYKEAGVLYAGMDYE